MYGIVNKSIEELIVQNYGADKWEEIKTKTGIEISYFISSETYDDEITFKLANAIAGELNVTVSDVLKTFGEWWILHTGRKNYGYLLESGGDNFKTFLLNLPAFHNRVIMMYPKLTPPEFKITKVEDCSLHLHYLSKRKGLTDFVIGLLSGLGKFFSTAVHLEHIETIPSDATHEVIKVSWDKI